MSGVSLYFGITLSGKTTLARHHLEHDVNRGGRPALILDCMPARNLRDIPHQDSVAAVVEALYAEGAHACYTPKSEAELELLLGAVHEAGIRGAPVSVLWDEASLNQSPHHIGDAMAQAVRGWQHNDCTFRVVTQRPADLNGVFFACMPEVFCFRLERPADLERVEAELRLDPQVISALNQGEHLSYLRDRFQTVKGKAHDDRKQSGAPASDSGHADAVHAPEVQQPTPPVPGALSQDLDKGGSVPPEA